MLRYLGQSMSYVPFHNRKPLKEFGKHNSGNKMKSLSGEGPLTLVTLVKSIRTSRSATRTHK